MNSSQVLTVAVTAIFVQNIVMVLMLCDGSFFRAIKKPVKALWYGIFVTASMTVVSMLTWLVNQFILKRFSVEWLSAFVFILLIVIIEVAAELIISYAAPAHKKSLHKILPASAFNCAVLGVVFVNIQINKSGFFGTTFYGICAGIGYLAALFVAASALERVRFSTPSDAFKGLPIAFVTASIISLAFMGFSGMAIPY
jgi:electron transport complex protein RnfA